MHRRWLGRLSVVIAVASCCSVGLVLTPALAASPALQGWWASTNPGGTPAAPSATPDVPADGLLVEAGPSGPSAYAALSYEIETGTTAATLTLTTAPNTATTPSAKLVLCALTDTTFTTAQGGPLAEAPKYNCKRTTVATLDGSTFTFRVAALAADDALAVAVLPGDTTTRVVLAHPGDTSLATSGGQSGSTAPSAEPATTSSDPSAGTASPAAVGPDNQGLSGSSSTGLAGISSIMPAPALASAKDNTPAAAQVPQVVTGTIETAPVPAVGLAAAQTQLNGNRVRRVLATLLVAVLACAGVLWAFAGGNGGGRVGSG